MVTDLSDCRICVFRVSHLSLSCSLSRSPSGNKSILYLYIFWSLHSCLFKSHCIHADCCSMIPRPGLLSDVCALILPTCTRSGSTPWVRPIMCWLSVTDISNWMVLTLVLGSRAPSTMAAVACQSHVASVLSKTVHWFAFWKVKHKEEIWKAEHRSDMQGVPKEFQSLIASCLPLGHMYIAERFEHRVHECKFGLNLRLKAIKIVGGWYNLERLTSSHLIGQVIT